MNIYFINFMDLACCSYVPLGLPSRCHHLSLPPAPPPPQPYNEQQSFPLVTLVALVLLSASAARAICTSNGITYCDSAVLTPAYGAGCTTYQSDRDIDNPFVCREVFQLCVTSGFINYQQVCPSIHI